MTRNDEPRNHERFGTGLMVGPYLLLKSGNVLQYCIICKAVNNKNNMCRVCYEPSAAKATSHLTIDRHPSPDWYFPLRVPVKWEPPANSDVR
jgi:hypothetical protein